MPKENKPPKYGILYIHGAGLAEDQTSLIGDPLATLGDGLLDHFQGDRFIHEHYRMTAKTDEVKDRATQELEFSIFPIDQAGVADRPKCVIRMNEVLWKPMAPKLPFSTYLPLLWQWAFAFQSNFQRKDIERLNVKARRKREQQALRRSQRVHARQGIKRDGTKQEVEEAISRERHNYEFVSRVWLALLGLSATLVWFVIIDEILKKRFHLGWVVGNLLMGLGLNWTPADLLTQTSAVVTAASFTAAVLLLLLAKREKDDSNEEKPHGELHLLAIALTTAWLAIFLIPFILIVYYLDRVVKLVVELGFVAAILLVALSGGDLLTRILLLMAIAVVVFAITRPRIRKTPSLWAQFFRENMRFRLVNLLTTLMVTGGAPWLILLIWVLGLGSVLPFLGDNFKQLTKIFSDLGQWQALKDIYMILVDSSRSAVVRNMVEEAINDLDEQGDLEAIHIFAHSFGTVVAYDTLTQIGLGNGSFIEKGKGNSKKQRLYKKIKTLVTFGCPLNKVRTLAKFQGTFAGFDYDRFGTDKKLPKDLGRGDFRWVNVYTPHDYVSDACIKYHDDPVPPAEFTAWSANDIATAHGIYWSDRGFWNTALEAMGIIYPRGEMTRVEDVSESDLSGDLKNLLESDAVQKQIKSEQMGKAQDVLKQFDKSHQLVERLRDLGIVTVAQFSTQLSQAQPIALLQDLGVVSEEKLEKTKGE